MNINTAYPATQNTFAVAMTNGDITALGATNGVYGTPGALPTNSWQSSNYFCPRCGGRRRIVAVYPGGQRLRELLDRLGLTDSPAATGVP